MKFDLSLHNRYRSWLNSSLLSSTRILLVSAGLLQLRRSPVYKPYVHVASTSLLGSRETG